MGLPWLKVREDLHEDPAVLRIASQLDTRPEHVVGYCVRFWAWVSRNCHGGSVTGVTLLSVERVLNLPGFCDMLRDVGWLEYDDSGAQPVITIPKYDRHLSDGAKERALATERKSKERKRKESGEGEKMPDSAIAHSHDSVTDMSRCERDKSVTRGEERRGDKRIEEKEREQARTRENQSERPTPFGWSPVEYAEAVELWREFRFTQEGKYPPDMQIEQITLQKASAGWTSEKFLRSVRASIAWGAKTVRDADEDYEKQRANGNAKSKAKHVIPIEECF